MKRGLFICLLTLFLTGFASINHAAPLPVITSFSILGDVTRQIGGERVQVRNLIGTDQDAHMYQLVSKDLRDMRTAKLILLNGLGLEPLALQRAAQQSRVPMFTVTQNIKPLMLADDGHGHHQHTDPHVWNDPVLMQIYARNIANALISVDPQGKAYYQQRLTAYQQQLAGLNNWASKMFNAVPAEKRKVLTGHDAFGYMAKRYRIEFIAPQGMSTEAEPSARQVAAIISQIRRDHIKAIFMENIKNPKMVQRIASETQTKISGRLYSDALSKAAPAATYIDMFRYNVNALCNAMK
ncbi:MULTISPECIES: metal ABC transporter substrate-binding protein [unclassified Snodgrassella]|uniref:metal ABC transporter substrate-binding protein n=1 Tax=unclassified Snodgrassella TaxID=2625236 RepID=UPI0018DEA65E|nr:MULTISPECIES: metal ABC transporter substrate-binding protein [unclassified Snodgrassella]MBI0158193.1 metal ABC transporter substrate-binding protein [Snodgrassella sp. W6238H11]MBI0159983.1 metal ABC transporter substrate-binding protein [Snodgrassella sp. W6238H14]